MYDSANISFLMALFKLMKILQLEKIMAEDWRKRDGDQTL